MRLTHDAHALTGVGDGILGVDGVAVSDHAGKPCPLNSIRFIYQHHAHLETRLASAPEIEPITLSPVGAHTLRAGGGTWASLFDDGLRVNGVRWLFEVGPGLWDVDPDGRVLMCPDYNTGPNAGAGIQWRNAESRTLVKEIPPHVTGPIRNDPAMGGPCVRSLSGLRAAWISNGAVLTTGIPGYVRRHDAEIFYWVVPVELPSGDVWLLEYSTRLTLRPADSLAGLVLTEGIAFGPDAVALSDELVLVGWANASAERPEDLVLHHVPLEDERIDLSYPPRSAVVRPHRAFALASYAFGDDCTPLADVVLPMQAAPETVDAYVEDGYEIIDRTDLALDVPAWALYAGERSGVSCEAAIDEARPQAERDGVGLLVYQDSREIRDSVVAKLRKGDALAPQCYLEHGEPVADFARRVREECDRLAARLPAGVVLMPAVGWHTRKDDAHPDGLPAASLCWAWVALTGLADLGQWFGLIGFREGLADFCEALAPYLEDFDSGIPVLAYPPTPDPPPDPVDPTDPDLPDIDPPAPPFIPEAVALSIEGDIMRGYLRHRVTRKVARVDPAPRPGASGNHQWPVNWDKDDAGGHELGELLKDGDRFVFRFEACGRVLCLNGAGQWETRADAGGDERFLVTDQPEGVTFLYRSPAGAPVELCEFVEAAA